MLRLSFRNVLTQFAAIHMAFHHWITEMTQEFPNFLSNLKVHQCVCKSPPLVPVLSHTTPSYFYKIQLDVIHLNT
jgi:hypothetical protein